MAPLLVILRSDLVIHRMTATRKIGGRGVKRGAAEKQARDAGPSRRRVGLALAEAFAHFPVALFVAEPSA
jgi:hypothetical protein